jgi:hypothetical protein
MLDIAPVVWSSPAAWRLRNGRVAIGLPAGFSTWMVEQISPFDTGPFWG